jgi:hypothetical protein
MAIGEELNRFYAQAVLDLVQASAQDSRVNRALSRYACPFVPYVGENYEKERPRIVIVGKATDGWDSPDCANLAQFYSRSTPDNFASWSSDFILKRVLPYTEKTEMLRKIAMESPFWRHVYGLISAIIEKSGQLNYEKSRHARYVGIFRRMASELIKRQQNDGLWRANLDDPQEVPNPETSGTAFFCFGLAWGINNGILDPKEYEAPVVKAFTGLLQSVSSEGKVQWATSGRAAESCFA